MIVLDAVLWLAQGVLLIVAFAAVPAVVRAGLMAAVRGFRLEEYNQVPVFGKLLIAAGLMLAAAAIVQFSESPFGERSLFHPREILAPEGPWALGYFEFIELRVAAFPGALVDAVVTAIVEPGDLPSVLTLAALSFVLLACAIGFAIFTPAKAIAAAGLSILRGLLVAFVGFYLVVGAAWLLSELGVWALVLPILYLRPPIYFTNG